MDKKKKELILIAILVPVLTFVVYTNFIAVSDRPEAPPRPADPAPPPVGIPADPPPVPRPDRVEPRVIDEKILDMQADIAEMPWERDPFRPPPVREEDRPVQDLRDFQLSGIISGRMAIINGESIRVGDEYRGYRLREAEHYRIILEKDDQTFILNISEE